MIKDFFDYLATPLSLTKGVDFHLGHIPEEEADNGTALMERVGATVDSDNTNFRRHRFQFLTRNKSYVAGDIEARRIFDIVIALRGEQTTGAYLYDVIGNAPAYIGQDKKQRHLFSANVTVSARKE